MRNVTKYEKWLSFDEFSILFDKLLTTRKIKNPLDFIDIDDENFSEICSALVTNYLYKL